jgi:hypothetical protein
MTGRLLVSVAAAVSLSLAGCGGDESEPTPTPPPEASPAAKARANANCRAFRSEVEAIGRSALRDADLTQVLTEGLVRPSIPALKRIGARQQALMTEADSPSFALYANLFDPIIVLAQERLRLGRASELAGSREIEKLLTELGLEQMAAARQAGLRDCNVDFQSILLSSLSE